MRIKTEKEFIKEFGENWYDNVKYSWDRDMDYLFNYKLTEEECERFNTYGLTLGTWNISNDMVTGIDAVTSPTHYTTGEIECIDAIRSALTEEEFRGYCKGNILKYTWREKLKGGDEDLKKAKQYLKFMEASQ